MSEFMGQVSGRHGAKSGDGFAPGGASLHSIMSGHGPDAGVHNLATNAPLPPMKMQSGSLGRIETPNWALLFSLITPKDLCLRHHSFLASRSGG